VKRRIAIATALAATLLGAAACSSTETPATTANPLDGKGKTLKVWLMVDAQSGWPEVVKQANDRFTAATGAAVQVDYQIWDAHLAKLDTTLAGSDVPDVVELGNTEFSKYVFNGAFNALDKAKFENSAEWLTGLSGPCESDGKTYCVPYYAGARVLHYRTDLFKKAGLEAPKTYEDVIAAATKLKADNAGNKKFSAFYAPGAHQYMGLGWIYGSGGSVAKKEGDKWVANLSSPESQAGLTKWADLVKNFSAGDPTKDEQDQGNIFAQGESAMFYGNGWEGPGTETQLKDPNDPKSERVPSKVAGKLASVPMPSIPSFLGGSNVGVTAKSANKELAAEWIKYFTDTTSQKALIAKGALPNATNLLDEAAKVKGNEATALAAKSSFFTPNSPNWANVETAKVIQTLLVDIASGKSSTVDAAKKADDKINELLNAS
jgi:N,N'-diacetylchitobiose transport system substrate-binding protein